MPESFQERLNTILQGCSPEAREGVEQTRLRHRQAGGTSFESTLALCVDRRAAPPVRGTACWVLGQLADTGAVAVLVQALGDDDAAVRREAAGSLAAIGDASAVAPLIQTFQRDSETEVRRMAVNALWRIGDPAATPPIIAALLDHHEPPGLRSDCADALGQMADDGDLHEPGKKAALEALLAVLQDESTEVRCFAAFALGMLRDPSALPALRHLMVTDEGTDPRWGPVREEAKEAIALIEGRRDRRCDVPEGD